MDALLSIVDVAASAPLAHPQTAQTEFQTFKDMRASWLIVQEAECAWLGIQPALLKSSLRTARVALVRHFIALCIHRKTKQSIAGIGRMFDRDHTSIMHGLRRMQKLEAELGGFENLRAHVLRTWKEKR
jgi:chromosomal replication initiation ATPase DnaA